MMDALIRCIECNEIFNMTQGDTSPRYTWHEGEIKEEESDDRDAFLQKHKGHTIEKLTSLTPPISDKPYTEPVKTSFFEATNGTKRFLIKRWRDTIEQPFTYEIIDGRLDFNHGKIGVQTHAIRKQLRAEYDPSISEEQINYFINAIHKEAEKIDPATLMVSAEGETPLISYYHLGDATLERILIRCQDTFNHDELELLRNFMREHNEYDGVMTVLVHKEFAIKPVRESEFPQTSHLEQRISLHNR
ncbi:MAG: hypothetical protein JXA50_07600 [Deltaproteobacteria bacterium]|nr:hypothetical protein [Deltaproteobacteria bacterium]